MSNLYQISNKFLSIQVVEQTWRFFNQMTFLRSTNKYHFRWILYLKRKWHNNRRKQKLISKNYKFIDVKRFKKLRNFDWNKQFVWDKTQTTEHISQNNNEILTVTKQITNNDTNRPNKRKKLISSSPNYNLTNQNHNNDNSNNHSPSKKRRRLL